MDLFLQPSIEFEKLSAETTLPEDPNAWPHEVLQELYKQVPYISDFSPHVVMDKVDGERGYGFGYVEVMNQTEIQSGEDPEALQAAGVRQVRIPVIINDCKLQAFDLMLTDASQILPLTEARLRSAIFRPQAFDVTGRTPGDQSMIGQLYPPYRQNFGFGGGGAMMDAGIGKEGSALEAYLLGSKQIDTWGPGDVHRYSAPKEKTADALDDYAASSVKHDRLGKKSVTKEAEVGMLDAFIAKHASAGGTLLKAIVPAINYTDHQDFVRFVSNPQVQASLYKNAAALVPSVKLLLEAEPMTTSKIASTLPAFIAPSVVQISRAEGGYRVKTASHLYWEPSVELVDRGDVIRRFGEKVALAVDMSGAATLAEGATAAEEDAPAEAAGPITSSGTYKVYDEGGQELVGMVVSGLLDVNGTELPLALFTNGKQSAVQADIIGVPAEGGEAPLPSSPTPSGSGFFFSEGPEGIQATIPLTLQGSFSGVDGGLAGGFQAETFDGASVVVSPQPNIQTVIGMDNRMFVPAHWQWSPLSGTQSVALMSSEPPPEEPEEKQASIAVVSSGAGTFSMRGVPLAKLAHAQREFLSLDDAMFLLAGFGVEQGYGAMKLGQAMAGREPVKVKIGRAIITQEERRSEAVKLAEERLGKLPNFRKNLWKEAAEISDPMAVDTVLSLGFINPENLMTFVGYLPTIEESQQKLCDLLLATRLGQTEISQGALERSIRSTEEVLEGLKALAFQTN